MVQRMMGTVSVWRFTAAVLLAAAAGPAFAAGASSGVNGAAKSPFQWNEAKTREAARQIDALVEKGFVQFKVSPTRLTTDEEFLRRAYLDITGTIPNLDQAEAFLLSTSPTRRAELIDYLLTSKGHVSHAYNFWADLLRVQSRTRGDSSNAYGRWLRDSLAQNKPYDWMVYEMLTAEGKAEDNGAAGFWLRDQGMNLDVMANTSQLFLGTQIGCAQCHDHPFDKWTQLQFYEMAAYVNGVQTRIRPGDGDLAKFRGIREILRKPDLDNRTRQMLQRMVREASYGVSDNPRQALRLPDDYKYDNAKPRQVVEPDTIFGGDAAAGQGVSPREAFARWMISPDNPRFATVIANRLWAKLMGVGIVEPVDEYYEDTTGRNPELLAYLTQLMIDLRFDMRQYQRILLSTRTYQRAAASEAAPIEQHQFQSGRLRRMTAEQVWDAFLTLAIPDPDEREGFQTANRYGGLSQLVESAKDADELLEIAEKLAKNPREAQAMMAGNAQADMRAAMARRGFMPQLVRAAEMPSPAPPGHFLREFGQSEREVINGSNDDPSVPQALALMNGQVTTLLLDRRSVLMQNIERAETPQRKVEVIFLSMLVRKPSAGELRMAMDELKADEREGFANIIWALANTREFLFVQ